MKINLTEICGHCLQNRGEHNAWEAACPMTGIRKYFTILIEGIPFHANTKFESVDVVKMNNINDVVERLLK